MSKDKPSRLVWICGGAAQLMTMPDKPLGLVWAHGGAVAMERMSVEPSGCVENDVEW